MPLSGNKGEWSEFYVLLRVLSDSTLTIASGVEYKVCAVRDTSDSLVCEYRITDDQVLVLDVSGAQLSVFSRAELGRLAEVVLERIRSGSGTFSIDETRDFIARSGIRSLHTQRAGKTDTQLVVYDPRTHSTLVLGFSIKSLLGSRPTLFNANRGSTNFAYVLDGLEGTRQTVEAINGIQGSRKYRDRVAAVRDRGGSFRFERVETGILGLNLQVVDSRLPEILAWMVVEFFSGGPASILLLTDAVEEANPCDFDQSLGHPFYARKMKAFLRDAALGMTANSLWTGAIEATGGYIVVNTDGGLECTHAFEMNMFEDYLWRCTALDGPSGARHGYGEAYLEGNEVRFTLPLQVRFLG